MALSVSAKPSFLVELKRIIGETLGRNLVSTRTLRAVAGKANHLAGLVPVVRPFLGAIWAAIYQEGSQAPRDTVW
eukprot:2529390-Amphidinium_carterae.1